MHIGVPSVSLAGVYRFEMDSHSKSIYDDSTKPF